MNEHMATNFLTDFKVENLSIKGDAQLLQIILVHRRAVGIHVKILLINMSSNVEKPE